VKEKKMERFPTGIPELDLKIFLNLPGKDLIEVCGKS
jgi:hypothetical protein